MKKDRYYPGQVFFDYHDEAGSILVSVIAVQNWEMAKKQLEVSFPIDAATALEMAIPITQRGEQEIVDAFSAALKIGLPTKTFSQTKTTTQEGEQSPTTNTTRTETEASGDASTAPAHQVSTIPEKAVPTEKIAATDLGRDSLLLHRNAQTLYQAIQLINNRIESAPIRENYEAYVVTIQVSLIPYARMSPYDAYLTLSIFESDTKTNPIPKTPVIVPLIVTDNLEAAGLSDSSNKLRQFGFGLAGLLGNVSILPNFDKLSQDLERSLSEQYNSLITVGRLAPETFQARLGAISQGKDHFAMVPRTHDLSMLVLIPDEAFRGNKTALVDLKGVVDLRNTFTGTILPDRSEAYDRLRSDIDYYLGSDKKFDDLKSKPRSSSITKFEKEILDLAAQGEYANFISKIHNRAISSNYKEAYTILKDLHNLDTMWVDLMRVWLGGKYISDKIEFRKPKKKNPPTSLAGSETVIFEDDGNAISTTFQYPKGADALKIEGRLVAKIDGKRYNFLASSSTPSERSLAFSFPSLSKLHLTPRETDSIFLEVNYPNDSPRQRQGIYFRKIIPEE